MILIFARIRRRAEARQLLKEVVDYEPKEKEITVVDEDGSEKKVISKSYLTHTIRCKGASIVGKQRKLKFGNDAMEWLKKWVEVRGKDDCPYMFVIKKQKMEKFVRLVKILLMVGAKAYLRKSLVAEYILTYSESQELQTLLYMNINRQKLHKNYLDITM